MDWLVTMTACWKLSCRIAGPASCMISFRSAPQVPLWMSSPLSSHGPLGSSGTRGSPILPEVPIWKSFVFPRGPLASHVQGLHWYKTMH